VVALVLVGVQAGESADRSGELRAFPDVAVDGHRVPGPGVGAGERLAAYGGELGEVRRNQLGGRDDLHIAELGCEVGRHDRRGTAVVVPGGERHPLVPEGGQLGDPQLVLGQDRFQRIVPAVALRPMPQRASAHPFSRGPP
jgi:hypothetical protein